MQRVSRFSGKKSTSVPPMSGNFSPSYPYTDPVVVFKGVKFCTRGQPNRRKIYSLGILKACLEEGLKLLRLGKSLRTTAESRKSVIMLSAMSKGNPLCGVLEVAQDILQQSCRRDATQFNIHGPPEYHFFSPPHQTLENF